MAGIPEHIIDEIRQRADIVEVVSGYLQLKKSGANWRALCPFHEEKTPSFNVNPERQIFHCFGCGEGGNVFTFVMKIENIPFPEAARLLAGRYGIAIPEEGGRKHDSEIEKLYAAMEAAADFYHRQLLGQAPDSPVSNYVKKRGISPEVVKKFRIGWAPDAWDTLAIHMTGAGFDQKLIEKAGLVKLSSKGNYIDRFRARLMFPVTDASGKVIAFGGRVIGGDTAEAPKYINSPETPIYSKSRVLYGFHQGAQAARREGFMIIVEGYMDVIALSRAGIENCAAVSGTAFTPRQAELVTRVCDSVVALFDSDAAGLAAAKRSVPILLDHGVGVRVLTLPGAKDPDDFLSSHGGGEFLELVRQATPFPRFIIEAALSGADLGSIEGRAKAAREVIPYLRRIKDNIERSQYIHMLADRTGTDYEVLTREVEKTAPSSGAERRAPAPARESAALNTEKVLIRILLDRPEYIKDIAGDVAPEDFSAPLNRKIFELLQLAVAKGVKNAADIVGMARDEEERNAVAALVQERDLFDEKDAESAARDLVNRLRYSPERRRKIMEELKSAASEGDFGRFRKAQEKYFEFRKKQV